MNWHVLLLGSFGGGVLLGKSRLAPEVTSKFLVEAGGSQARTSSGAQQSYGRLDDNILRGRLITGIDYRYTASAKLGCTQKSRQHGLVGAHSTTEGAIKVQIQDVAHWRTIVIVSSQKKTEAERQSSSNIGYTTKRERCWGLSVRSSR